MNHPRPLTLDAFRAHNRDFGILPFWFLNGELDPDEMRFQLKELRDKGMQGVVFHGRYGLEMDYLGDKYLDRIRLGVEEANRLGLASWIYDEMNWPSGTADKRVLKARPDLAQRYIECHSFSIQGPWFMCLTGEDSRYLDFERSTPLAMFAIAEDGRVIDLTSNLSFKKVIPWEVPAGHWRLCYIVEKRADYYIDALDPESTKTFLRLGYDPYMETLASGDDGKDRSVVGFYSDEPSMHYFLTAQDNPIVPWTKDMFRRFQERNGYDLRSRLLDLFFDLSPESARTRHDYYNTTTAFYSDAYYGQLQDWCHDHDLEFTAHLLYEELIRQMVRVEGNAFRHYERMDVVAVDHLYPVIGTSHQPDQHVAMKLASSAAHHVGSERLICESFGGIFMDATMQRMKWIADWEYVLGVNVLNPHGFHYTFEGARKRDWPPSMFYQYPWWTYYERFSEYMSRTSEMLTGGRHVAKIAMVWPINAMFAKYLPQEHTPESRAIEAGLTVLTDRLLRLHHDFDYIDEDVLAAAEVRDGKLCVANEDYEMVILPPMGHIRGATVDALEGFVAAGGKVLGTLMAPSTAFVDEGMVDVSDRIATLFGGAGESERDFEVVSSPSGAGAFIAGDPALLYGGPGPEQDRFAEVLDGAIRSLIAPDVECSNPDVFVLHRRKDGSDIYFVINTTFEAQEADLVLTGEAEPVSWDPTSGEDARLSTRIADGRTSFSLSLPPVGSRFVITGTAATMPELATAPEVTDTTELGGPWTFEAEDDNALVIQRWRATPEFNGEDAEKYVDLDLDDGDWLEVGAGAWAYQLPAEPERPWPIPVWYRISFEVDARPGRLALLIDGFDGDDAAVWLNGEAVTAPSIRSRIDAQMRELDLTGEAREGRNVLAVRLVLGDATCGLVDHVKLLGDFLVSGDENSGYRIGIGDRAHAPGTWTEQGYPFYSGRGVYRATFELAEIPDGLRLEVPMRDDVLEVELNGSVVGIRLWDPYEVELSSAARAGTNELALRVANTPANLLNADRRNSGLAGVPRLVSGTSGERP